MTWQELYKAGQDLAKEVRVMVGQDWQDWQLRMWQYKAVMLTELKDDYPFSTPYPDYRWLAVSLAFRLTSVYEDMPGGVVDCWIACYREWLSNELGELRLG